MSDALLTIGIPSRNRAGYLRESLGVLVDQVAGLGPRAGRIALHVSDNASTDATGELVRAFQGRCSRLTCHRHHENVGASRNVMSCVAAARSPFCWVVGDDELICPGGVGHLLDLLESEAPPDLVICFDTGYDPVLERPRRFASYREYATACARVNPHALIEHTLVSSNVFRTVLFDQAVAERTLATDYSHMYAVLSGIRDRGGSVHVTDVPVITVRQRRAPAVDGVWPSDLEASWLEFLRWQKKEFDLGELEPEAAIRHVRQVLVGKLMRHPFRYVWNNLAALKDPRAWRWFVRRLIFHARSRR
jgi:glycosyltransferase involved in cell wall biosynthesis